MLGLPGSRQGTRNFQSVSSKKFCKREGPGDAYMTTPSAVSPGSMAKDTQEFLEPAYLKAVEHQNLVRIQPYV